MKSSHSVQFFDKQFQQQAKAGDFHLNPFETAALNYLQGSVLDFGCGMGNLSFAAAQRGCSVWALDGSPAAIRHIQQRARDENLSVYADLVDLRNHEVEGEFDAVVSIGLLMFFDCTTARHQLDQLKARVRPGGIIVINVLSEGTTFFDMFEPEAHCLFKRGELTEAFADWEILEKSFEVFPAPENTIKAFDTLVARKSGCT